MATVEPQPNGSSGPSLEDVLFRNLDRWTEQPALVDRELFAAHIEEVFGLDPFSSEAFVERFFSGDPALAMRRPADLAEAVVRATKTRLQVYQFNLDRFEYVVLEEDDKVVVVSDLGSFAIERDDVVAAAIQRAIIPEKTDVARSSSSTSQPRAYLIQRDGTLVALDVPKLASALDRFALRQVSMPRVSAPSERLAQFAPTRRALSDERETQLLRQDPRGRKAMAQAPDLNALLAGLGLDKGKQSAEPPATANASVFLVMPDGSLARPAMGAATRWKDMVSDWVVRAALLSLGQTKSMSVSGGDKFAIESGKVVALFASSRDAAGYPGMAGQRAEGSSEAISLGRSGDASIRVLGDEELALAISRGAVIVPGLMASAPTDRFWVQPETFFAPSSEEKKRLSRDLLGLDSDEPALLAGNGQPSSARLGAITGDPWADWALTTGGSVGADELLLAANGREKLLSSSKGRVMLAALARADATGAEIMMGPDGRELRLPGGAPVVAFRSPDGSFVLQRSLPSLRLAELGRPEGGSIDGANLEGFSPGALRLADRTGSLPATVFAALSLALERSAGIGGFRLPPVRIWANPDALSVGERWQLGAGDPRRSSVMLAGAPSIYDGAAGQVGRLLLSLPFPNSGELHVGQDLGEALHAMLDAPAVPTATSSSSGLPFGAVRSLTSDVSTASPGRDGVAVRFVGGGGGGGGGFGDFDASSVHGQATQSARRAMLTLQLPSVAGLISGSPSVAGLPGLLARALDASEGWAPGPGAALPGSIQSLALRGPIGDFVVPAQARPTDEPRRPLGIGEDEIVIPMPLWAQMGRGRISSTEAIMASRLAPAGYAPPLGAYRLVMPGSMPLDFTGGRPPGSPSIAQLTGPTRLDLVADAERGGVSAQSPAGRYTLANVAIEGGDQGLDRRRIRIGAPIGSAAGPSGTAALAEDAPSGALVVPAGSEARRSSSARPPLDGRTDLEQGRRFEGDRKADDAQRDAARQVEQTQAAQREAKDASRPASPASEGGSQARADGFAPAEEAGSRRPGSMASIDPDRPLTSALQGALRTSDEVAGRLQPLASGPGGNLAATLGTPGMSLVAAPPRAESRSHEGSASDTSGAGSSSSSAATSSSGPSRSSRSAAPPPASATGSFSSPAAAVVASPPSRSSAPITTSLESSSSPSESIPSARFPSAPSSSTSNANRLAAQAQDLEARSSDAVRASERASRRSSSARGDAIGGLPPGSWSGHRRGDRNFTSWAWSRSSGGSSIMNYGGVPLATGLGRPSYPALPSSLRFRYVAAPLWWSSGSRGSRGVGDSYEVEGGGSDGSSSSGIGEGGSTPSQRALRSGLRAANSAATLWRSILVRAPAEGGSGRSDGQEGSDAGGMDRSWESSASALSSLAGRFDALGSATLVEGSPQQQSGQRDGDMSAGSVGTAAANVAAASRAVGQGPQSLYVAVDKAGRGGLVDPRSSVINKITNVEMNIVAAVPPQPPTLEQMASFSPAYTRRSGGGGEAAEAPAEESAGGGETKAAGASKIEGSVEAIAQRIYHRIRRRIASDRERFGG